MFYAQPRIALHYERHKLLWDFGIQRYYLISARQPILLIVNMNKKKKNKKRELAE